MELVHFIAEDRQRFIGTLVLIGLVGFILVSIVEAWRKK